eukprot:Nitzschia sp. Nitz4//scaffold23_size168460//109220//110122//NITZ4_002231-RA/size168460-processed-gene-0.228-mRNA-1//1//CDS//3329543671//8775//frame0
MIDRCLQGIWDSFPSAANCPVIVACDGVRQIIEEKEGTSKRAYTRRVFGKCNRDQWDRYGLYCDELASRTWLQVYRSEDWKGFSLLLRHAIQQMVSTPLVYVSPHDYELIPSTLEHVQLPSLLQQTLLASPLSKAAAQPIHYIGLPNKRSATFGVRHENALRTIPSLQIDTPPKGTYTLEPLAMWKENPHFATTQAYNDIVFSNATFKKGQFIEDTLGQSMLASIKRDGLSAFQQLYLLALPTSLACSFHMDGPRYLPIAKRLERNYTVRDFEIQAAARASLEVHQRQQLSQTSFQLDDV